MLCVSGRGLTAIVIDEDDDDNQVMVATRSKVCRRVPNPAYRKLNVIFTVISNTR